MSFTTTTTEQKKENKIMIIAEWSGTVLIKHQSGIWQLASKQYDDS